mmetsp:Transcript_4752/g.11288  ORF Transcript_4752/g.11288 Transcript_4752/m.11288 type:complete len:220 (+) Transcript_4752:311-970(+)
MQRRYGGVQCHLARSLLLAAQPGRMHCRVGLICGELGDLRCESIVLVLLLLGALVSLGPHDAGQTFELRRRSQELRLRIRHLLGRGGAGGGVLAGGSARQLRHLVGRCGARRLGRVSEHVRRQLAAALGRLADQHLQLLGHLLHLRGARDHVVRVGIEHLVAELGDLRGKIFHRTALDGQHFVQRWSLRCRFRRRRQHQREPSDPHGSQFQSSGRERPC